MVAPLLFSNVSRNRSRNQRFRVHRKSQPR